MKKIWILIAAMVLLMAPVISQADLFGFSRITNNVNLDVGGQLSVNVTASDSGVLFTFSNNVGIASSITDIYFDDGTLLALSTITESAGVAFSQFATPHDLPGGGGISPAFTTTVGFSLDSSEPTMARGVNASTEWVAVFFSLKNDQTFADTIAALDNGSLRIGLRVQSIGGTGGGGDSYVNRIPEPGTLLLLGSGLLGMALVGRRKFRD